MLKKHHDIQLGNYDKFNEIVQHIENKYEKRTYKRTSGRTTFVGYKKQDNKYIKHKRIAHTANGIYKGLHIVNMFESSLRKNIASGKYRIEPEYVKHRYSQHKRFQHFAIFNNRENLLNTYRQGGDIFEIDMDNCYWQTAFNLGMMDERTYKMGMATSGGLCRHKEWKEGRLIAIGNLGNRFSYKEVVNGQSPPYLDGEYAVIQNIYTIYRIRIIDEVFRNALRIADIVKGDLLMYLTDAFFVSSEDAKNRIILELQQLGYNIKTKKYQIKKFEEKNNGSSDISWKSGKNNMHFREKDNINTVATNFKKLIAIQTIL